MSNTVSPPSPGIGSPGLFGGADVANAGMPTATLDAESLLAYCSSRLSTLDGLIRERFAGQQQRNKDLEALSKTMADLNTFSGGINPKAVHDDAGALQNHITAANLLIADYNATSSDEVKGKIAAFYNAITGNKIENLPQAPGGGRIGPVTKDMIHDDEIKAFSAEAWTAQVNDLKPMQDKMSKDNEMTMIELQSIVSQRQLAIQLTTQMMQTLHEGAKAVVSNIRG